MFYRNPLEKIMNCQKEKKSKSIFVVLLGHGQCGVTKFIMYEILGYG